MALAISEPTTTLTTNAPECCGQAMRPKESFVTQSQYHQCTKCLRNTYSQVATITSHTHHAHTKD